MRALFRTDAIRTPYETNEFKFSLSGVEHTWEGSVLFIALKCICLQNNSTKNSVNSNTRYGESEESNHIDWDAKEVRQTVAARKST